MSGQQFGLVQIIAIAVALVATVSTLRSVQRLRIMDSLLTLAMAIVAFAVLGASLAIQGYTNLDQSVLVATVQARTFSNASNQLSVEIKLYDTSGKTMSDSTYAVLGNEWVMQADVIETSPIMSMIGLHSGFKLTRLEGRYDDSNLERTAKHTVIDLNGGDDHLFQIVQHLGWLVGPFISATYGNAVIDGPGNFTVYASRADLWAKGD